MCTKFINKRMCSMLFYFLWYKPVLIWQLKWCLSEHIQWYGSNCELHFVQSHKVYLRFIFILSRDHWLQSCMWQNQHGSLCIEIWGNKWESALHVCAETFGGVTCHMIMNECWLQTWNHAQFFITGTLLKKINTISISTAKSADKIRLIYISSVSETGLHHVVLSHLQ